MSPDSPLWRTIGARATRAATWPFRVAAARATLRELANMDRRELADIGLSPSDLRDASALALDRDPGELLARRACERRRAACGQPASFPDARSPLDDPEDRPRRNPPPSRPEPKRMKRAEALVRTG